MLGLPTFMPDPATAPAPAPAAAPVLGDPNAGAISSGLASGFNALRATTARAFQGGATLLGADAVARGYAANARGFDVAAQRAQNPILEQQDWLGSNSGGIGGFISKAVYRGAQAVPNIAGAVGGAIIGGAALPAAPVLGPILGGAAFTIPQSFGEQVKTADEHGGLTREKAAQAAVQAVPTGVLQALVPGEAGALARGVEGVVGSTATRIGREGLTNAAIGSLGAGAQAAADGTFDPNKTASEKASDIVSAAAQGAVAGGLMGAGFGLLGHAATKSPAAATNADLVQGVDAALGRQQGPDGAPQGPLPASQIGPEQGPYAPFVGPREGTNAPLSARTVEGVYGPDQRVQSQPATPPLPDAQRAADAVSQRIARLGQPAPDQSVGAVGARIRELAGQPPAAEPVPVDRAPAAPEGSRALDDISTRLAGGEPAGPPDLDTLAERINALAGRKPAAPADRAPAAGPKDLADIGARIDGRQPYKAPDLETVADRINALGKPPAGPEPELKQAELPLAGPLEGQGDLFSTPTYDAGRAPAAATELPPKNVAAQGVLDDVGLKANRLPASVKDFVLKSQASDLPTFYNEVDKFAKDNPKIAQSNPSFGKILERLGVGTDQDVALATAQARATPDPVEIADIQQKIKLRDQALAAKEGTATAAIPPEAPAVAGGEDAAAAGASPVAASEATPPDLTEAPPLSELRAVKPRDTVGTPPEAPSLALDVAPTPPTAPVDAGPRALSDRILDVARTAVGDKGGEVSIADLRKALPDVHAKDLENALREIHASDTDTTLVQNPKGQRTGVDGVSVPGLGRMHRLELEPRTPDAVQERGATPEDAGAAPAGEVRGDGTGNAEAAPGARQAEGAGAEPQGAGQPVGEAAPAVEDANGLLPGQTPEMKAAGFRPVRDPQGRLNPLPGESPAETAARDQRLKGLGEMLGIMERQALEPAPSKSVPEVTPTDRAIAAETAARPVEAGVEPLAKAARTRTKAKTSVIRTKQGDQVPTDAVGGSVADLGQAAATDAPPLKLAVPGDDILFKRPADQMPGVPTTAHPRDQVQAHFDKIVGKLRADVRGKVHLVDGPEGIPADATKYDLQNVSGAYYDGQVYIRADMMRSLGELEDTLSHEIMGHMATRAVLPGYSAWTSALSRMFDATGGIDGITKIARQNGVLSAKDAGHNLNGGEGLAAYLPPPGTELTPHLKAQIMDELSAHVAAANPSALDRAIQNVQDLARKSVVNVMRRAGLGEYARKMDRFTATDMRKWLDETRQALAEPVPEGALDLSAGADTPTHFFQDGGPSGEAPFMARISAAQRDTEGTYAVAARIRDYLANRWDWSQHESLPTNLRRLVANVVTGNGLMEQAVRNGLTSTREHYRLASEVKPSIEARHLQTGAKAMQDLLDYRAADPKRAGDLEDMMIRATTGDVDPRIPFAQHTWLQGLDPQELAEKGKIHAALNKTWHALGQSGPGQQIFNDMATLGRTNWYSQKAMYLHATMRDVHGQEPLGYDPAERAAGLDPTFVDAQGNQRANLELHGNVNGTHDYWRDQFTQLAEVAQHVSKAVSDPALGRLAKGMLEGEQSQVMGSPYFHMGRTGDIAVRAKVVQTRDANDKPTGFSDPAALKAIREYTAEHYPQLAFNLEGGNPQIYTRFVNENVANGFANLFQEGGALHQFVEPNSTGVSNITSGDRGLEKLVPFLTQHLEKAKEVFDRRIERVAGTNSEEAANLLRAERDRYVADLRRTLFDQMGDSAPGVFQQRRTNALGASSDVWQNQRAALASSARTISTSSVLARQSKALAEAQAAIKATSDAGGKDVVKKVTYQQDLLNAITSRNAAAQVAQGDGWAAFAKNKIHTFQLGMSPSYMLMNVAQLPTLTLPQLAKTHGYVAAAGAMARATLDAGVILGKVVRSGEYLRGGLTQDILNSVDRLSVSDRQHLTDLDNRGELEMGSYGATHSGIAYGSLSRFEKVQHFANATATLSELAGRLVTGLAAKRLYDAMPEGAARDAFQKRFPTSADYGSHSIREGMFQWGSYNTPKLFTAGGGLGQAGPLITQFHGYIPRLFEKIYREAADGFTSRLGEGPVADAARKEARSFILGHLAAVTAISGSLGLPAVGWALGAATRLSGAFLDQPYDMEAHYRGFLADTFGKGVGEIVSRGLPRYLGVDLSDLGDDKMLPLSGLIQDRARMEDAIPNYLSHAWGSSVGIATNMALGARELSEGRFLEGAARMLPASMRNVVRAYKLSENGYTNGNGQALPMTAGAADIIKTALGFKPGEQAEQKDRQEAFEAGRKDSSYRAGRISNQYANAAERGDAGGVQDALAASQRYDQDHPGAPLSNRLSSFALNRRREAAIAASPMGGGVLGLKPNDFFNQGLVKF